MSVNLNMVTMARLQGVHMRVCVRARARACVRVQYLGFAAWLKLLYVSCSYTCDTVDEYGLCLRTGKEEALSSSLSFSVLPS